MLSPDLFILGGSAAATAFTLWRWRRLDGVTDPDSSDATAGVPVELRPAASIVTDSAQLAVMWRKGSVLWSIVNGLGPAIKAGLVDILLGDPKGGMEFGRGEGRLWTDFQWTADGIIGMLATAEAEMQERAARFKAAGIRKFTPSIDEPLKVIIIDEYAALSAFATREQVTEGLRLLGLILTQGRAVGYSVIVALQDPSKENMPNRQLFSVRIGLRFDEPSQTTMVPRPGGQGSRCSLPRDRLHHSRCRLRRSGRRQRFRKGPRVLGLR